MYVDIVIDIVMKTNIFTKSYYHHYQFHAWRSSDDAIKLC